MLGARALRCPRWQKYATCYQRAYSVRIPGDAHAAVRTIADLKEFQSPQPVSDVQVCGWVRSVRKSAGVRFVDVTDGSSMRPIQAVVEKTLSSELVPSISTGAHARLLTCATQHSAWFRSSSCRQLERWVACQTRSDTTSLTGAVPGGRRGA